MSKAKVEEFLRGIEFCIRLARPIKGESAYADMVKLVALVRGLIGMMSPGLQEEMYAEAERIINRRITDKELTG